MVPTSLLCTVFPFLHSLLKEEGMLRTDRVQRRPLCVLVYVMLISHVEM